MAGESSSGALREIIALFSLGVDDEELKRGEREVQGFLKGVRQVGEVVAEAFAVHLVKDFFKEQIEAAAHVQDLAERLDVSAASLKEFGIVAAGAGVDFDSAAQSLGFLQKNLGEAETKGGEAGAAFARLGIDAKKAANMPLPQLLGDVAEGLSKLPNQNQQAAAAMAIFGRQGRQLLPILRQGRAGIEGMTEEAKELTAGLGDDYYEAAKKAREEGERFGFALETIRARVTLAVLPGITKLLLSLKKGAISFIEFTKHTYFLKTAMIALGVGGALKLIATLGKVGKALGLLKPTIGETIAALWKFAAPLVIAAALYLVFDEFYTLMHGGKTVIGDVLNELTGDTDASTKFAIKLNEIWSAIPGVMKGVGEILAGVIIPFFTETWDICVGIGKILEDVATLHFDDIGKDFSDTMNTMKKDAATAAKTIKDGWKDVTNPGGDSGAIAAARAAGVRNSDILAAQNNGKGLNIAQALAATKEGNERKIAAEIHYGGKRAIAAKEAAAKGDLYSPNFTVHVNQTNHFASGGEDAAKKVGKATGQGVATAAQKATNNARINLRQP